MIQEVRNGRVIEMLRLSSASGCQIFAFAGARNVDVDCAMGAKEGQNDGYNRERPSIEMLNI